jgi:RNA polymerase sigma-70 factor (ECF subfamily)
LADSLRRALAQLPNQEATVFCLCSLEGRSYQEVARALDLEPSTVGVILHRTRARLRASLAAFFEC